ncbi:MAG: outer membrane protein assembly factor BamE [Sulfuricella sp.]|nr:outer membrane protein assembly factor BamE [Sulfuricella sp.]
MRLPILALVLLLPACSYIPMAPSVYKIDIQQGNVVTQEMVSRLKPGMTRSQVRFALGTPLVSDVFHPDRWDYVYRFQKAGVLTEQHHITVVFENDLLKRVEGDVVPAASEKPAIAVPAAEGRPAEKAE